MVKVHVWDFKGKTEAWGHASMSVQNSYYISWWPEASGRVRSNIHPNIYAAHPILHRQYRDDVIDEKSHPNHTINIDGLDENAIINWWRSFGIVDGFYGPPLPWKTFDMNCSTVVASALKIGGGDKYASRWSSWNVIWTPNKVLEYARIIQQNTKK